MDKIFFPCMSFSFKIPSPFFQREHHPQPRMHGHISVLEKSHFLQGVLWGLPSTANPQWQGCSKKLILRLRDPLGARRCPLTLPKHSHLCTAHSRIPEAAHSVSQIFIQRSGAWNAEDLKGTMVYWPFQIPSKTDSIDHRDGVRSLCNTFSYHSGQEKSAG